MTPTPQEAREALIDIRMAVSFRHVTAADKVDAYITASEKEIAALKLELGLKRPTDADKAQTIKARKDYRAKLKELYGNADALPMEIARLKSQFAAQAELLKRAREVLGQVAKHARPYITTSDAVLPRRVVNEAAQLVQKIKGE